MTFDLHIWKVVTEKKTLSQIGQLLAQGHYYDWTLKQLDPESGGPQFSEFAF